MHVAARNKPHTWSAITTASFVEAQEYVGKVKKTRFCIHTMHVTVKVAALNNTDTQKLYRALLHTCCTQAAWLHNYSLTFVLTYLQTYLHDSTTAY